VPFDDFEEEFNFQFVAETPWSAYWAGQALGGMGEEFRMLVF
jgi:hypothetical protein